MGGLFGAYLARAGEDVILIDVAEAAVEAINRDGVTIETKAGACECVPVAATTRPESAGAVDLIVNFVKGYHTEAAILSARPLLRDDTAILTLQNGWGHADRIAALVGRERVLVGLTYSSATLLAPGRVRHTGSGVTHLGELDGRATARLEAAAAALRRAGFEVSLSSRIVEEIWKKLALNVCTLPTAALLRFAAHELIHHDGATALMQALLAEVVAVARAQGIALDEAERWQAILRLLAQAVGARASMLQDVEARRPTEIDVINGAIVEAGRRLGVATPFNDSMVWMVKSLQEAYLAPPPT